jgi:membrane-associated phospholipid phosphatase
LTRRFRAGILALAFVLLPVTALAAAAPVARVAGDAGALATAPLAWDGPAWGALAFAAAGGAALYQRDGDIRRFLQGRRGPAGNRAADWGNAVGDIRVAAPLLAGAALWGRASDRPELEATGWTALEAAVLAEGATVALKVAAGRGRPEAGRGPHDWSGPRTGPDERLSFPSGHSACAFAAASVIARAHPGSAVPYAAYGAATLTAFARLETDAHWATDVWGGAAIGLWVGHTLAGRHPSPSGPDLALLPVTGGAEAVLTWRR